MFIGKRCPVGLQLNIPLEIPSDVDMNLQKQYHGLLKTMDIYA